MPPHQREGNQQVADEGDEDEEMEFQNGKRVIKVVYGHSDCKYSENECCKQLHLMYSGSWDMMSMRVIKTVCRAMVAATPTSRVAPHHK
jgi:hypothetical protein